MRSATVWSRGPDASWPSRRRTYDLVRVNHACIGNPRPQHPETLVSFTLVYTTMRRAQSVRHYARASVSHVPTTVTDDLGVLKEAPEESTEVAFRKQLLEKSKENDKVWCS